VKSHGFHEGWDKEWESWTIDEDKLLDYMEEVVNPEDAAAPHGECSQEAPRCFCKMLELMDRICD